MPLNGSYPSIIHVAAAMVEIEPGLNKVQGYKFLGELRRAMVALKAGEETAAA